MSSPTSLSSSPPTRAEWVDQLLRRAILSGELLPGERLHGERLAEQWGVSATPLRETFQRLAGEGLVVIESQRGARVAPIDAAAVADIYEMRLLLDPVALRSSMQTAAGDPGYLADVKNAHRRLLGRHHSMMSFHDAHRDFHLSCVSRCPNTRLLHQVAQLLDHSQRYHVLGMAAHRRGAPGEEHRRLHDAIVSGQIRSAVAVLTRHLTGTRDAVIAGRDG